MQYLSNGKRKFLILFAIAALAALLMYHPSLVSAASRLGSAQGFAVLATSTITNTHGADLNTQIYGDLGLSPGTSVTGFPPGTVNGTQYINDATAASAVADAGAAYTNLAALAYTTDLTGQDLGGMTLTPGVYRFNAAAALTGTLTLNLQNDPDAEIIFQIGSTLTTASDANVVVINDTGCNVDDSVYWLVGSSATLNPDTTFRGTILAQVSITLGARVRLYGRAFAPVAGAVSLIDDLVALSSTPTSIGLSSFTATPQSGEIILKWKTESEQDNAGFNLLRSKTEDGGYARINSALIVATGGATTGAEYVFIDDTAKAGVTYYYILEDIDDDGTSTSHGPVSATIPRKPAAVNYYLPYWFDMYGMYSKPVQLPIPYTNFPLYYNTNFPLYYNTNSPFLLPFYYTNYLFWLE